MNFKRLRELWFSYRYHKLGCTLCKLKYKPTPWCLNRRKQNRKKFCYRFKFGYTYANYKFNKKNETK